MGLAQDSTQPDPFVYVDICINDVEIILKNKMENDGVIVGDDGSVTNMTYLTTYDKNTNTGTITVRLNSQESKVLKYINVAALASKNEGSSMSNDEFSEMLSKKICDEKCDCFYLQKDFKMGLLNCYSPIIGNVKNEIMSKLINDEMYGSIIVGLENHLNDDNRLLSLNSTVFKKILNLCSQVDEKFKPKNELFCNVFYEISHM